MIIIFLALFLWCQVVDFFFCSLKSNNNTREIFTLFDQSYQAFNICKPFSNCFISNDTTTWPYNFRSNYTLIPLATWIKFLSIKFQPLCSCLVPLDSAFLYLFVRVCLQLCVFLILKGFHT